MAVVAGVDTRVVSPLFTDLDEVPTAADATPTVTVSSAIVGALPTPAVGAAPETGYYTATLTADDHLASVDQLTLTWSAEVDGAERTLRQTVDVAGGVYIPTHALASERTVPDTGIELHAIRAWRDVFEALAEEARGVAFVPRLAIETHDWPCHGRILLNRAQVREVVAVWVDDELVDDLDPFTLSGGYYSGPLAGRVRVAYTHGHDAPPQPLVQACKLFVRAKVLSDTSDMQQTVLSFTNLATGESYRYGTADWSRGRFTGMEAVDNLIAQVTDERIPGLA